MIKLNIIIESKIKSSIKEEAQEMEAKINKIVYFSRLWFKTQHKVFNLLFVFLCKKKYFIYLKIFFFNFIVVVFRTRFF